MKTRVVKPSELRLLSSWCFINVQELRWNWHRSIQRTIARGG